jgi:hypothetical protein
MKSQKLITIIAFAIGIVSIVFWALIASGKNDPWIDIMMTLCFALVVLAAAIVLFFTFKNIASNGEKLKKAGMALGAFAIIFAIAYGMSDGEETLMKNGDTLSAGGSKMVSAGLNMFYTMAMLAVALMVFFGFKKAIK